VGVCLPSVRDRPEEVGMKAVVDKETCTGCGLCCDTCPSVFEMSDDVAVVIVDEVAPEAEDSCREAAGSCPVEAITLQD
jgi:ferredoxin